MLDWWKMVRIEWEMVRIEWDSYGSDGSKVNAH